MLFMICLSPIREVIVTQRREIVHLMYFNLFDSSIRLQNRFLDANISKNASMARIYS